MMNHIFVNCIAAGQIDWKSPLTAAHQPSIRDCHMIVQGDDNGPTVIAELAGPSAENLNRYAEFLARGYIVVGHSVEYHHGHLRVAMMQAGIDPCDGRVNTICTMLGLVGVVPKFNGKRGWPKFDEVCHHYGLDRAGTETAEDNARVLARVFDIATRTGVEFEPKIWKDRHG